MERVVELILTIILVLVICFVISLFIPPLKLVFLSLLTPLVEVVKQFYLSNFVVSIIVFAVVIIAMNLAGYAIGKRKENRAWYIVTAIIDLISLLFLGINLFN